MSAGARSLLSALLGSLAALPAAGTALADVAFEVRNEAAFLHSDRLAPGDAEQFQQFLAEPRAAPIRIVYLDSRGGDTGTAIAIGRSIRSHGLATAFHVGRARCVSACTTMFLGGVARYYIGGRAVRDGVATHLGLGFHPSTGGASGETSIAAYYQDMGVTGAATWRYKIYSRETAEAPGGGQRFLLFFIGGRSARDSGVATSLEAPADPRLRD